MRVLRRLIPSMFHRRLVLLLTVVACATAVLCGQIVRLTVVRGEALRGEVERTLMTRRLIPTMRGSILDRKGRVLAQDLPSYDVLVDYDVLTERWVYQQARRLALADHREKWGKLSFDQREALVAGYLPVFREQLENIWSELAVASGLEREELEARRTKIIERVQAVRADAWARWQRERERLLGRPVELNEVDQDVREEREAHTLLSALSEERATDLIQLVQQKRLPGVRVEQAKRRVYPWSSFEVELDGSHLPSPLRYSGVRTINVENLASNLIGSVRKVWVDDIPHRPYELSDGGVDLGGYRADDQIGSVGVESAEEDRLRGTRGVVLGKSGEDSEERLPPVPGKDVNLTIDIALQARISAIMDPKFGLMRVHDWHDNDELPAGEELYGAAVVIEVDTGDILAMVSTPTPPLYKPGEPYPDLDIDPNLPHYNKALQVNYPPGSTLKPIVFAIAATEQKVEWDQHVECRGHYFENNQEVFRCWGYRPSEGRYGVHDSLDPIGAIAQSCNIFFYTCGDRLGAERLVKGLHQWGFGEPMNLGVARTSVGLMPSLTGRNIAGRELSRQNAILMGIGQGPIAVPPVQVVAAHAALARGGYYRSPLLVRHRAHEQVEHDLHVPSRVIETTLRGMYESANTDLGTAHHIKIAGERERTITMEGVMIHAKTGTAEANAQYELVRTTDEVGNEKIVPNRRKILRDGFHGWYLMHVKKPGSDRASYVVAVLVEFGGSGGKVAGPVANQILYALKAEGYF